MVSLWLQAEKSGELVTEKLFELQISNRLASPSLLVGSWVHFYGFPEILVGYVRMSINFQATRDPVCDGSEILEAAVAARAAASQLEQSVYGLNRR